MTELTLELPNFEGPLDLLLHLIKEQKIENCWRVFCHELNFAADQIANAFAAKRFYARR